MIVEDCFMFKMFLLEPVNECLAAGYQNVFAVVVQSDRAAATATFPRPACNQSGGACRSTGLCDCGIELV